MPTNPKRELAQAWFTDGKGILHHMEQKNVNASESGRVSSVLILPQFHAHGRGVS